MVYCALNWSPINMRDLTIKCKHIKFVIVSILCSTKRVTSAGSPRMTRCTPLSHHIMFGAPNFLFFRCWHFSFFSSKTIGHFTILPMTHNWQLCPFRELSNDTANFFWIDIAHIICFALQSFSLAFYYLHDIDNTGRL